MEVKFEELSRLRDLTRHNTVVLAGGCYDLLHIGHVDFLQRCRELGDILVVATSADTRIKERKGLSRPIIPQAQRVTLLSALTCVDYALVAPEPNPENGIPTVMIIDALQPTIFATSDERFNSYSEELAAKGTKVIHVPDRRLCSTTGIIARIKSI